MSQNLSLEAFVACRSRSMPQFLLFLTTLWHDSIAYDARNERKGGRREGRREGRQAGHWRCSVWPSNDVARSVFITRRGHCMDAGKWSS